MSISTPLLYSIPLVPLIGVAWASQLKGAKTLRSLSSKRTGAVADVLLKQFLASKDLKDVAVLKSEDYSQNAYVEDEGAIRLSPDVIGSIDAVSVALALRAGAQTDAARRRPEKTRLVKKLRSLETLLFWLAFCVLAFGLMSSSAFFSLAGYACVLASWGVWSYKLSVLKTIDSDVTAFARSSDALAKDEREAVVKAIEAEQKKL